MNKVPWVPEKDFEEIAAEATQRMNNQKPERAVCVKDSNYCTSCGRCQEEEGEL